MPISSMGTSCARGRGRHPAGRWPNVGNPAPVRHHQASSLGRRSATVAAPRPAARVPVQHEELSSTWRSQLSHEQMGLVASDRLRCPRALLPDTWLASSPAPPAGGSSPPRGWGSLHQHRGTRLALDIQHVQPQLLRRHLARDAPRLGVARLPAWEPPVGVPVGGVRSRVRGLGRAVRDPRHPGGAGVSSWKCTCAEGFGVGGGSSVPRARTNHCFA